MEPIKISKGVAMMIRAVLNITPEQVEAQVNNLIAKSENAFLTMKNTLGHFDGRLTRIEAELTALKETNAQLNDMLNRWDHERRDFQSKSGNGEDRAATE